MKQLPIIVFCIVALVQLYVPTRMVLNSEKVIRQGNVYKFKTRPVDPNDPFRGKYMVLRFEADDYEVGAEIEWDRGEEAFVHLGTDEAGFARILDVTREIPSAGVDYVQVGVAYVHQTSSGKRLGVNYPFDRFYMEEFKAPLVDSLFRVLSADPEKNVYALVNIKEGKAVLTELMVDEMAITDMVE